MFSSIIVIILLLIIVITIFILKENSIPIVVKKMGPRTLCSAQGPAPLKSGLDHNSFNKIVFARNKNKPKFKGSRQKIVILTTISSYLFIVSLLVACNHNIDLFILSGMPNHCH